MTDSDIYRQSWTPVPEYRGDIDQYSRDLKNHIERFEGDYFENHRRVVEVWDDLRFPAASLTVIGALAASPAEYFGGAVIDFTSGNKDQNLQFAAQLPHSWKEGSDIEFHVHVAGEVSVAGTVDWSFTYTWANIDATIVTEIGVENTQIISNNDTHVLFDIGDLSGVGKEISSMLLCQLKRASTTDNYTGDVHLLEADFHYQKDTNGSRTEDTK